MNLSLQIINFTGVLALAALCVIQWRANRQVNLEANALEKTRIEHVAKLEEQEKLISGLTVDLDSFREQLAHANVRANQAESKLAASERTVLQLTTEGEQFKESVTNWANAVTARDEQLKIAAEQLQKLAADRNDALTKFNELAEKYNSAMKDLNERTRQFNELIDKYNRLATP
jgi:chromosome segregation ATPase